MAQHDRRRSREEAAKFWAEHEITDDNSEQVTEEIQVRKPLSAMISLRLSDDDLSKLKLVAQAQGVGVTTMARMLIHQCLENPGSQLMLQALQTKEVQEGITEILEDASIPQREPNPEFLVLSRAHLEQIHNAITQSTIKLLFEGLKGQSVSVTPSEGELFDRLREMTEVSRMTGRSTKWSDADPNPA